MEQKKFGKVEVNDNCWIEAKCLIMKNTKLPRFCIVQVDCIFNKKYDIPENAVIGPSTNIVLKQS